MRGGTLQRLVEQAAAIGLGARALRLEPQELPQLACPCILHWDLDHFVVLLRADARRAHLLDPALGERRLPLAVLSRHFSGVALELLGVLLLGAALLLAGQTGLGLARGWMLLVFGQSLALQWGGRVFAHLLRLPPAYFERRHLGDIVSRFSAVGAIQQSLTGVAAEGLLDGLMALAALAMMLVYAPALAGVVLAALAAYALLRALAFGPLRDAAAERLVVAAREGSFFLETLRAIVPLRLYGREADRQARWQNLRIELHNRDLRTARLLLGFSTAQAAIFGAENLLVMWLGAQRVMAGPAAAEPFTLGMLFAFLAYKLQFTGRAAALVDHVVALRMLGLHAERLADIVQEPAEPAGDGVAAPGDDPQRPLVPRLSLHGVGFRHGDGEPWLLRGVDFCVEPGECVALTGPSGAGKTTLLKLLLGLLEPTEGEVRYGGVPLRQLGAGRLRATIGTVMQDDVLLSGSLAENIACFDPAPQAARIEDCARLAQVHADILAMPMGYRTRVGDLGQGLSGGQRQRVLLARALYKAPAVLALDEATSHLDLAAERAVTAALAALPMTRLVIAHRPQTLAGAQRVVRRRGAHGRRHR
ncbi:ATP-binding cassette domain-containing protein [Piscinibacter sakaiensis]|uniref:peptidase domain-containing ABC transporter n=1 Tax=Piscinibacter sakaiensis TaxID=1547922 RepID=UPI00372BE631